MGSVKVDQIEPSGALVQDFDTKLSEREKNALLLDALPGARVDSYAGERVVRFQDQVIMKRQITHLGIPWESFKKRIQIPNSWINAERQAATDQLVPRFMGIYHYKGVTIFVDFEPTTYVQRKANNSAAHVATNDLYQAHTLGQFSRVDRNGNRLTSVRANELARYLQGGYEPKEHRLEAFQRFNNEFLVGEQIYSLDAVKEMHAALWPDTFQGEWPGFYVEFRLDNFIRRAGLTGIIEYQKIKHHGMFDYDLVFKHNRKVEYYGDLKASDIARNESPGNDAEDLMRCVAEFGRFWYVVYEHETWHSRDNGDFATVAWNKWRHSVGHRGRKPYHPLSYARKFKESVRFVEMKILEVNEANFRVILGDFNQGRQPDGAARALKVMINKRNIDNFLIYSDRVS